MSGQIPKEKLAAIIELIGEIPDAGVAYAATKDGQQFELQGNDLYNVIENACSAWSNGHDLEVTKVIIENKYGTKERILQHCETGTIYTINEKFIEMIDNKEIDERSGHTEADGPVCGRLPGVFWMNNVMALYVMPMQDDSSMRLIRHLEGIEINAESDEIPKDEGKEET